MYRNDKIGMTISVAITAIAIGFVASLNSSENGSIQPQGQAIIDRTSDELQDAPEVLEELVVDTAQTTENKLSGVIEETEEVIAESDSISELVDNTSDSVEEILPDVPRVVKQDEGKLLELVVIPENTSVPGCEEANACYVPFEAVMSAGGEVIWTNEDVVAHTVTSGNPRDGPDGLFDSGLIMPGDTYSIKLDLPFEYDYFCMVHPWMEGTITTK